MIQAAVSKMTNGEKYVCIARTVEKGVGRFGQSKSILSIGLGCDAKYAKDFVYTENINVSDKTSEIPIGVSCRTCDRLDCPQRAFHRYIKNLMLILIREVFRFMLTISPVNQDFQSPILLNKKFLNAVILAVFLRDCG